MVEWKKLDEVCDIMTGGDTPENCIKGQLCPSESHPYPVYSNGDEVYGYSPSCRINKDAVTISSIGNVGSVFYREANFTPIIRLKVVIPKESLKTKYLYYSLLDYKFVGTNSSLSSMKAADIKRITIPIPSLTEQQRIVGILDMFTSSIDNLKQQIVQRRKQYEYYRDQLLDLEGKEGVVIVPLREIVKSYCTGATPNKGHLEYYESGTIPWLRTQDVKFNEIYEINSFVTEEAVAKTGVKWIPSNCVIVAISGATAGRCAINKIPTTTNQHCLNLEINPKKALYKYVYYCVYNAYSDMVSRKQGARGDLNSSIILGITIPLPSLSEQQRILDILDKFETSIQNLEAQLSQREKQYEYYRNKLLTFK